jgi:hypothetical protein
MFCFKKVPKECSNSNCQILSGKTTFKFVMKQPTKAQTKVRPVKKQPEGKENMCLKDNLTTQFKLQKVDKKPESAMKPRF